MREVILGEKIDLNELLGKAIKIYLKDGGKFHFKVTGAEIEGNNTEGITEKYVIGFDDNGHDLKISVWDIDFIIGG